MFKHSSKVGRGLQVLVVLALGLSAAAKLSGAQAVVDNFAKFGLAGLERPIGITELLCVVFFVIPRTSFVGAILISAYLGGAVLTDIRAGEVPAPPVILGVLAWVAYGLLNEPVMRSALGLKPAGAPNVAA